jgi:hypothetical protein
MSLIYFVMIMLCSASFGLWLGIRLWHDYEHPSSQVRDRPKKAEMANVVSSQQAFAGLQARIQQMETSELLRLQAQYQGPWQGNIAGHNMNTYIGDPVAYRQAWDKEHGF